MFLAFAWHFSFMSSTVQEKGDSLLKWQVSSACLPPRRRCVLFLQGRGVDCLPPAGLPFPNDDPSRSHLGTELRLSSGFYSVTQYFPDCCGKNSNALHLAVYAWGGGWGMLHQTGTVSWISGLLVLRIPGSTLSLPVRGSIWELEVT